MMFIAYKTFNGTIVQISVTKDETVYDMANRLLEEYYSEACLYALTKTGDIKHFQPVNPIPRHWIGKNGTLNFANAPITYYDPQDWFQAVNSQQSEIYFFSSNKWTYYDGWDWYDLKKYHIKKQLSGNETVKALLDTLEQNSIPYVTLDKEHVEGLELVLRRSDVDYITFHQGPEVPEICESLHSEVLETTQTSVYKNWYITATC